MELSSFWFVLLFLIPFMYLCLQKLKTGIKNGVENVRLPPGTSGLPFIGETFSLFLKNQKGVQHEFISDRMRRYSSNIFRTSLMGEKVVVMSSAEGNKFIFTNEGKLVESWYPWRIEKVFHKSGAQTTHVHGQMIRNVFHPRFLKVGGLQECMGVMDITMKQHLEAYWSRSKDDDHKVMIIKAAEMAKRYALGVTCNVLFRINDLTEIEQYLEGLKAIEGAFVAAPIDLPGTAWNRGLNASKAMILRFEALIKENKENDFFTDMVLEKDENGESMLLHDVAANCVGLLEAGYTTLQATITMLIKALADHPHVYDSVLQASCKNAGIQWEDIQKMKYSWNVVREVMRRYLAGPGFFKEALTDITYQGYSIPKGWKIFWLPQSTQMDPKYFPNPEEFDPSRWDREVVVPYTFVPFGAGSGICPGHMLAKHEILTFLHYVVTKFRWERVNPNEKMLIDFHPYPAEGLPIRLYHH